MRLGSQLQRPAALAAMVLPLILTHAAQSQRPLQTTIQDFHLDGSQEGTLGEFSGNDPIVAPFICGFCHVDYGDPVVSPIYSDWEGSMMAQSLRDPMFQACLQIANQDAVDVGDMCIRCHSPKGWLEGRSQPTDGVLLTEDDRQGISCNFCHRLLSIGPRSDELPSPICEGCDETIRLALLSEGNLPTEPGSGRYVVDPLDRRRGPFSDVACHSYHDTLPRTDYFRSSEVCATCHDVSNPVYTRIGDDYVLGSTDSEHPTGRQWDMFPIERTYSEWANSSYAQPGGVDSGGRFGGNTPIVGSCQSCHMPRGRGDGQLMQGCGLNGTPLRLDVPMHFFHGANTWMPDVIANLYPNEVNVASLMANKQRSIQMHQAATTMQLSLDGGQLKTRVINETGHKLPTGYNEGRRMWVNVVFRDCEGSILEERGEYNQTTADLMTANTKVYEAHYGLDEAMAATSGLPVGPSFHFAINNRIYFDNRIPPRGFTNAGFAAVQAAPVAYAYADGQYWDDTLFALPPGTASADVALYYQTASKDYIEFLRDNNPEPPESPKNFGQILHDQWLLTGMSPPVRMNSGTLNIRPLGDLDASGVVDSADVPLLVNVLLGLDSDACRARLSDMNRDGLADGDDIPDFVLVLP